MEDIYNEQWKPIVGYEGLYEASSLGRIKSLNYRGVKGREQLLKPYLGGLEGYEHFYVSLCKNGVSKTWGVHVLVALSFPEICGEYFEGADANHIDENPFNNRADNINWLSHGDNLRWGTCQERKAKARSKTVFQYTKNYELVKEWVSTREVERQMGWSQANIAACARGKAKTAYGFVWSYTVL